MGPASEKFVASTSSLLLFFLILSGTYVGDIFSCEYRRALERSPWLKQTILFFILYVFVVQLDEEDDVPIYQSLLVTAALYGWFFLMMRVPLRLTFLNVVALFILYLLQVYKTGLPEAADRHRTLRRRVMWIQLGVVALSAIATLGGFWLFRHEGPLEQRNTWRRVFTGIPDRECYAVDFPHLREG